VENDLFLRAYPFRAFFMYPNNNGRAAINGDGGGRLFIDFDDSGRGRQLININL